MEQKIQELKEWVKHRVDYWEEICEKDKHFSDLEIGEYSGQLSAYLRIQQHINSEFGEWVKNDK